MGQWTLTVLACPLTVITLALAVHFLDPADGTSSARTILQALSGCR
jgi:hypothetical protein